MKKMSSSYVVTIPVDDKTDTLLGLIRSALKNSGFHISIFARNPNREQFYGKRHMCYDGIHLFKHYYAQNLPRKHATSLALYVRPAEWMRQLLTIRSKREKIAVKLALSAVHNALKS